MAAKTPDLMVRRHERFNCNLPATLEIGQKSLGSVRFAHGIVADAIPSAIVDCSHGGLGLQLPTFLPKSCQIVARFAGPDGPLEVPLRIQRVIMIDREPTYYLGTSFISLDDGHRASVDAFVQSIADAQPAPTDQGGGDDE